MYWLQNHRPGRRYPAAVRTAPKEPRCLQLTRAQKHHAHPIASLRGRRLTRARVHGQKHHTPELKGPAAADGAARGVAPVEGRLGGCSPPPLAVPRAALVMRWYFPVPCAIPSKAPILLSKVTQSNDKRVRRWNGACAPGPPISMPICMHMPRLVACGQSWRGGGWRCMHGGGWWCVEDGCGGVWTMGG